MRFAIVISFIAIVLLPCLATAQLSAATVTWLNDADGNWTVAENWSSNPSLPGLNDDVIIDADGFVTVVLSGTAQSIRSLVCNNTLNIGETLSLAADSQISGRLNLVGTVTGAGNWRLQVNSIGLAAHLAEPESSH